MPNLVDLLGQISLFAKLTMAVAIVAFGLAVTYVFRPTEQKLVLMRTCRWRVSIEASLNHSPLASSLSACSPPPGCLWLSAGYDVTRLLEEDRRSRSYS